MTLDLDDSTPFVKEMLRDVEINRLLPYDVVEQPDDPLNLGDLAQTLLDKLTGTGILGLAGFWAMVMQQSPSSTLTITGADIQATGNVTVTATTNSQLRLRTDSLWIGVNYGRSDATATLTVGTGTRIVAGGAVQLATNITNELRVGAIVTTGINARLIYAMKVATDKGGLVPGPALTAAVGEASSQSNTTVTAGATIEAATVTISANNSNDFQVTANSAVRGLAKANTGVAIAVVVSKIDSDANVSVGGTIRTTGDLTVSARSVGVYNYADARTTLKADKGPGIGGGKSAKVAEVLKDIDLETTSDPSAISAAGSVVVANSSNDARAVIAPSARISVRGNMLVSAYAEDNVKSYAIAIGTLESKPVDSDGDGEEEEEAGENEGSIAKVSLAGAVVVSNYHNGATARIGDGAIVNVANLLTIKADAVIPSQLTLDDLFAQLLARPIWSAPPSPNIDTSDPLAIAQQVSDAAKAYLAWVKDSATAPLGFINGVARPVILMAKYLPQRLVTTNVGALSGGKKITKDDDGNPQEEDRTTAAISGTVTVFSISNTANASIGTGALVNVQPDPDFAGDRSRHPTGRGHRHHRHPADQPRRPRPAGRAEGLPARHRHHRQGRHRRHLPGRDGDPRCTSHHRGRRPGGRADRRRRHRPQPVAHRRRHAAGRQRHAGRHLGCVHAARPDQRRPSADRGHGHRRRPATTSTSRPPTIRSPSRSAP